MTSNQKLVLIALGTFAAFLLVGQFALGHMMASGDAMRVSLRKYHQHLGYMMFGVSILYVFLSIWLIINAPTAPKRRP